MTSLRTTLLLLCLCMAGISVFAQNVTILPGGITPAQLGSYPRLSYDDIVALTSPQDGDIAYDVTFKCMRLYNGTKWVRLVSDDDLNIPSATGWSAGGTAGDAGVGIATDSSGNVFVAGFFRGTATFGDSTLTSNGDADIFLAKYNNTGILQWIRKAGGANDDVANDIVIDKSGNVIITGYFYFSATFESTTITAVGKADIYIAKYSNSGTLQWVEHGGGSENDVAYNIAMDEGNNIYITGYYYGNNVTFSGFPLSNAGLADIFLAKYNSGGSLQWIQGVNSPGTEVGRGIAVDSLGAVYLTGYYSSGSVTFGSTTLTNSGVYDTFIAKYSPTTSSWIWAKRVGGTGNDRANCIVLDTHSNIYITGFFESMSNFGSSTLTSEGQSDAFVAKYDNSGNLTWAKKIGGLNNDEGKSVALDSEGNIYIIGYFTATATSGNLSVTSTGDTDIYIAKFDSAGTIQWIQRYGSSNGDVGNSIISDINHNIYTTGFFQNTAKFGSKTLTSAGGNDIFVARIKE